MNSIIANLNSFLDTTLESLKNLEDYRDILEKAHIEDLSERYVDAYAWVCGMRDTLKKANISDQIQAGGFIICKHWAHIRGRCVSYLIPERYDVKFNTAPVDGGCEILNELIRTYENPEWRTRCEAEFAEAVVNILKKRADRLNRDIVKFGGEIG